MDKKTILLQLDKINDHKPGTLNGSESTEDWSSLTWLDLIALADEEFGKSLDISQLTDKKTVNDIVCMLVDDIA